MVNKDFLMIGWELNYSRNRVLLNKSNLEYEIIEISKDPYLKRQFNLLKIALRLIRSKDIKTIFIPAFNQTNSTFILVFGKLFKKKIIIDLLISDYDTLVNDRKLTNSWSLKAIKAYFNDYISVKLADILICDTYLHKKYFEKQFKGKQNKFRVIPVGAETLFTPQDINEISILNSKFRVLFYGGFSPLHGIHHIINAAEKLKDIDNIEFLLIGDGQTREEMGNITKRKELNNVRFIDHISYLQLPREIAKASIGLGIFGESEKVQRVIPNKVFQMASCGKPIITLDTPSIRELFEDGKDIILVDPDKNISNQIASMILKVKKDPILFNKLSIQAYNTINTKCSNETISKYFEEIVIDLRTNTRGVEILNAD